MAFTLSLSLSHTHTHTHTHNNRPPSIDPEQRALAVEQMREAGRASAAAEAVGARLQQYESLPGATKVADGIVVVPGFMQAQLGIGDPAAFHEYLTDTIPIYSASDQLERGVLKRVPGDHPALNYRGKQIPRSKVWLQRNHTGGFVKYRYTGWQHAISDATADVTDSPPLRDVMDRLSSSAEGVLRFNHGIYTWYDGLNDFIDYHTDKPDDIAEGSLICVLRTGPCARVWSIRKVVADGETTPPPVFHELVAPGTAIFMTLEANLKHQHSVVKEAKGNRGAGVDERSGSFVLRNIKTVVPWATVDKCQADAKKSKEARDAKKSKQAKDAASA